MATKAMKNTIMQRIESGRGLSATDALKLDGSDIRGLSRSELAYMVSTISSAANKRLDRLSRAGQPIEDTVDRFSVRGKDRGELLQELSRARNFMSAENMSLSGQARTRKKTAEGIARAQIPGASERAIRERLRHNKGAFDDPKQYDKFWKAYERLKERNPIVAEKQYKYRILDKLSQTMKASPRAHYWQTANKVEKIIEKEYMDTQQEEQEDTKDAFSFSGVI